MQTFKTNPPSLVSIHPSSSTQTGLLLAYSFQVPAGLAHGYVKWLLPGFPTLSVCCSLQLAFPNALVLLLLPVPTLPSQLPGKDLTLQVATCEWAGALLGCFEMMTLIHPPRRVTQQRSLQMFQVL